MRKGGGGQGRSEWREASSTAASGKWRSLRGRGRRAPRGGGGGADAQRRRLAGRHCLAVLQADGDRPVPPPWRRLNTHGEMKRMRLKCSRG